MGSVFLLGGALMGAPPHHHGPAVNALAHGSVAKNPRRLLGRDWMVVDYVTIQKHNIFEIFRNRLKTDSSEN